MGVTERVSNRYAYVPVFLAGVTDIITAIIVAKNQPEHPGMLVLFQFAMFAAALLSTASEIAVRLIGFLFLLTGAFITGFSVGMYYLPTVIAAGFFVVSKVDAPESSR